MTHYRTIHDHKPGDGVIKLDENRIQRSTQENYLNAF